MVQTARPPRPNRIDSKQTVLDLRSRYELLRSQMDNERSSFMSHWKDLGDWILPRRTRFFVQDANKGDRRNHRIIDNTATVAADVLASGLMSGVTSPARRWFKLTTPDPDLAESSAVKDWLHIVTERMSMVFDHSNLYQVLPEVYGDMGTFGTGAMLVEEDFDEVVRFYSLPIGSYYMGNDHRGKVGLFLRIFEMTVRQIVTRFGMDAGGEIDWTNISERVKSLWENHLEETWVEVVQVIEPNSEYNPRKKLSKYKKYRSVYYERGVIPSATGLNYTTAVDDKLLSDKGYDFFPVLCPRWKVTGEDVYGTMCPGMSSLGDVRQLQLGERRSSQAIDKMVSPPMQGPPSLKNQAVSILPGGMTYVDTPQGSPGFKPTFETNPRTAELEAKQAQIRKRIDKSYYVDLFLMLANDEREQPPTATEISERKEEKLLALGPVLTRLNQDMLNPLIDLTFYFMQRQGWIPQPPDELAGMPLRVEYTSILAAAQKALGLAGMDRFIGVLEQVAPLAPEVMDKINLDEFFQTYGDGVGLAPRIIRSDDEVQGIRQQKAQAAQAQQKLMAAESASKSAKNLATAPTDGKNALTDLINQGNAGNAVPTQ